MARIRSIHPGIYTDEAWASVSISARWFAKGICTEADDNGVFEWKPLQLKMRIFPADSVDVPALLQELADAGIVLQFSADGKTLGAVRNFCKFQRPRKPKAWFPLTDDVRTFVALGSESVSEDEPEAGPVPKKSEPVPPKSEKPPQMEDGGGRRKKGDANASLSPKGDASSKYSEEFEACWKAFPHVKGRSSKPKASGYWKRLPAEVRAALAPAITRYRSKGREPNDPCGAPAMDRWLRDGRYLDWMADESQATALGIIPFPDPEIRAAVISAKGEAWAASWLDPCTWEPEGRVIIPRTRLAAQRLQSEVNRVLQARRATVQPPTAH